MFSSSFKFVANDDVAAFFLITGETNGFGRPHCFGYGPFSNDLANEFLTGCMTLDDGFITFGEGAAGNILDDGLGGLMIKDPIDLCALI